MNDVLTAPSAPGAWFGGDRRTDEQLEGLGDVIAACKGRSVLDLGCAEGHIALRCNAAGAVRVDGCEILIHRVEEARRINRDYRGVYFTCDLDGFERFFKANKQALQRRYNVVLALSIAHKLLRPDEFLSRAAEMAMDLLAVRLPSPVIDDPRSGHMRVDVPRHLEARGFRLKAEPATCRGEWLGIFERR